MTENNGKNRKNECEHRDQKRTAKKLKNHFNTFVYYSLLSKNNKHSKLVTFLRIHPHS